MRTTKLAVAVAVGAAGALLAVAPAQAAPVKSVGASCNYVGRPVAPAYLRFLLRQRPAQCHVYGPVTVNRTWR